MCALSSILFTCLLFSFFFGGGGGVGSVGKQVMNVLFSNFELHERIQIISM